MKANELRIGNFVKGIKIGKVKTISSTHFQVDDEKCISLGNSLNEKFEPIPLTEEWLEKFGFEAGNRWYVLGELEVEFKNERLYVSFFGLELTVLDYVHELQNLYFAITGEELTLIK